MILRFPAIRATAGLACALSLLASAAQAQRVGSPAPSEGLDTGRLIVKYRSHTGEAPSARSEMAARVAANRQGVTLSHVKRTAGGAHVFKINRRMSRDEAHLMAANIVAGDADVEYAEPDRILRALRVPNDSLFAQQWSLADSAAGIRATTAWDTSLGSGVTVAVIDTGVRPHVDLLANLLPGYDFITDTFVSGDGNQRDADAYDPGDAVSANYCFRGDPASGSSWHGTHVAGIVAAVGNNAGGVAGVAYGAKVLPLRALGKCGGYTSDIADAIVWAAGGSVAGVPANPNPARVINLSLGGGGACDNTTQAAIDRVRALGAVVVVAAGNEASNVSNSSPANCRGVVAVAATGPSGGRASYSNFGTGVTLAAPGGDSGGGILSTLNSGSTVPAADSYAAYMGTSMATPAVSGVVALMLSANPRLTPDNVSSILQATARAFPASCNQCGAGLVDAAAAVASAAGTVVTPPPPAAAARAGLGAGCRAQQHDRQGAARAVAAGPGHRRRRQQHRHRLLQRQHRGRQDSERQPDPGQQGHLRPVCVHHGRQARGVGHRERRADPQAAHHQQGLGAGLDRAEGVPQQRPDRFVQPVAEPVMAVLPLAAGGRPR